MDERKIKVLEAAAAGAGKTKAARQTGVARATISEWRRNDPEFGAAWDALRDERAEHDDERRAEAQRVALETYAQGWSMTKAAQAAGVHRATVASWCKSDTEFAKAWAEAEQQGADILEDAAFERGMFGGSDRMLELMLKSRLPAKFTDRHKLEVSRVDPAEGMAELERMAQKILEADRQKVLTDDSDQQD
jgi:transcriptional regulator with XRE-family HTH domain